MLYHGLSACTGDNPLAKARGLAPRTGDQTMFNSYFVCSFRRGKKENLHLFQLYNQH